MVLNSGACEGSVVTFVVLNSGAYEGTVVTFEVLTAVLMKVL